MPHALYPLDVSYFKHLKITFKKGKDETMARKKNEPLKITLARWTKP